MINSMARDVRSLIEQAEEVGWYSRGSIQYHAALLLSPLERSIILDNINKRIEAQKKSEFKIF